MRAPEQKRAGLLASVSADGGFCGYASLFGRMDLSGDVVEAGAFARSLARRKTEGVGLLLEHDPNRTIGHWLYIEEDARGLWVEGQLGAAPAARQAARAMASGSLDGLSIGFSTISAEREGRVRRLVEVDLWEVSVVAAPMLPEARARAAGAVRETGGERPVTAVDAGLIAQMRRTTALFRQTR